MSSGKCGQVEVEYANMTGVKNDVDSDCSAVNADKLPPKRQGSTSVYTVLIQLSCSAVTADNFTAESSTPPSAQPTCEPPWVAKNVFGSQNLVGTESRFHFRR